MVVCLFVHLQNVITREEVIELVHGKKIKELHARFDKHIQFGTAGMYSLTSYSFRRFSEDLRLLLSRNFIVDNCLILRSTFGKLSTKSEKNPNQSYVLGIYTSYNWAIYF